MNDTLAYLSSNNGKALLFSGEKARFVGTNSNSLTNLDAFLAQHKDDYKVFMLSYDLKNEIETLSSKNNDLHEFPSVICWVPASVHEINHLETTHLSGSYNTPDFLEHLKNTKSNQLPTINFNARTTKADYLRHVQKIQAEIQAGNTYELNYCQEFYAEEIPSFNRYELINALNQLTQAPFSAFVNFDEFEIYCGSPERFLKKSGEKLISEPIKGTIARGKTKLKDEQNKISLQENPKERAENIMITDLVRNDLSRIAKKNSVQVIELCGIHTFATVHHMISTISCEVTPATKFTDILKATFPMGSMTGAPKISSMKIIDQHEDFKRGIYAGSIGYMKPNGDFDSNVVIRTLIRNTQKNTLSCCVGGAITIQSEAEKEYEECLVKVKRILQLFGDDQAC